MKPIKLLFIASVFSFVSCFSYLPIEEFPNKKMSKFLSEKILEKNKFYFPERLGLISDDCQVLKEFYNKGHMIVYSNNGKVDIFVSDKLYKYLDTYLIKFDGCECFDAIADYERFLFIDLPDDYALAKIAQIQIFNVENPPNEYRFFSYFSSDFDMDKKDKN